MMPAKKTAKAAFLIFVDTNILLDFYRVRAGDATLELLDLIDRNPGLFITNRIVEMEFKKHRQAAILESYQALKSAQWGAPTLPAFLARSRQSGALRKSRKQVETLLKTLKARALRVLRDPTRHDRVYRTFQKLRRHQSRWNLTQQKPEASAAVYKSARRRFECGAPPRKVGDTSMGDAIHWEWILRCAKESGKGVVIVSRDGDYGRAIEGEVMLNDWLVQEFRQRVSRKRRLVLTDKLSAGLAAAGIAVTKKQRESEQRFVQQGPPRVEGEQETFHDVLTRIFARRQALTAGEAALALLGIGAPMTAKEKKEPAASWGALNSWDDKD